MSAKVNLAEKLAAITEYWTPGIVAQLNNYQVKLVKVKGQFTWHAHADTDELFLVIEGALTIELPDEQVQLGPGELYVVAKGVRHRPCAEQECAVLLFEPEFTVNTGDQPGKFTVASPRRL